MKSNTKKVRSNIPFNYFTIKTTKSRIEKGLLAIPVSIIDIFPKYSKKILIVGNDGLSEQKNFTPYNSSSRECRIGGMKQFYEKYKIKDGDELVISIIDDNKFKIVPEKLFEKEVISIEKLIDKSTEIDIDKLFLKLSNITNQRKENVLESEFVRLSKLSINSRGLKIKPTRLYREEVPASTRKILMELYKGRCQVSQFTFLMKNGKPYFEFHHIDADKGHHLKNLLVVSPNIHAQFTYSAVRQKFDSDGWLRKVKFNQDEFSVFQIIDKINTDFYKETHY